MESAPSGPPVRTARPDRTGPTGLARPDWPDWTGPTGLARPDWPDRTGQRTGQRTGPCSRWGGGLGPGLADPAIRRGGAKAMVMFAVQGVQAA